MKNTKIIATIVATAIIATLTLNTYAMGNGNGQGQGMGKGNGQGQHQGQGQKSGSQSKHSRNPADMLVGVATGTLSEQDKLDLAYQYSEEMVARDAYNYFYSLYGVQTFKNIAESETEHMSAVKVLLDRYSLPIPTNYGELQDEFDTLKLEGEKGLKEALEVGVKIEILDINDIKDTIKSTDNDDIKIVFTNIGGASYNHMKGFLKGLANNGFTTNIDYSAYLTDEQVNSTGTLKYLLAEDLAKQGVVLPVQASAKNIQANCDKEEQAQGKGQRQGKGYGKNMTQEERLKMQDMKGKYKEQIGEKYGNSLSKMSDEKLKQIDDKIDTAMQKVEEKTSITHTVKQKTIALYQALKEYIAGLLR